MEHFLHFVADCPHLAMLVLGGATYGVHLALVVIAYLWGLVWCWLDEADKPEPNLYLDYLARRCYGESLTDLRESRRDALWISPYHWAVAATPLILFIMLSNINITLIAIVVYALALTARSGRRLQKTVTSHINDKNVHVSNEVNDD